MKVLILGASGWVAHYLIPELMSHDVEVLGVINSKSLKHKIKYIKLDINNQDFYKDIQKIKCSHIVNMLHSTDYILSRDIHEKLAQHCNLNKIHYTFMSSANALDGDPSEAHEEHKPPNGGSDYGIYKADCEDYLLKNYPEACIIRFPATHGFAPNRIARTEEFLIKLKKREIIPVASGIYQNRPFVGHLAKMIARLIRDNHGGVFHLGTHDQSDEYDFMSKLAAAFGYPLSQLTKGDQYHFYMTVLPKRIYDLYGEEFSFSEDDTIKKLKECPQLSQYMFLSEF